VLTDALQHVDEVVVWIEVVQATRDDKTLQLSGHYPPHLTVHIQDGITGRLRSSTETKTSAKSAPQSKKAPLFTERGLCV
jgi:hypothetical protein